MLPRLLFSLGILAAVTVASASAAEPLRAVIDRELKTNWKTQTITPAAKSTDAEFLRRVTLDLIGTIPTGDETIEFLSDTDPEKRSKRINKLLADPRFAKAQADVWDLLLFGRRPGNESETRVRPAFKAWLAKQFEEGTPYDKLAKELLVAEQPGSEMFLVQFRSQPEDAAVQISRIFLGTQLQCARCHDHPYDVWKQKDFYGVAGFFVRLVVQDGPTGPANTKSFSIGEKETGEVLFSGAAKDQKPGQKGDPVKPKFLGGEALAEPPTPKDTKAPPPLKSGEKLPKPSFSRKEKFAAWLTTAENPYFAKAAVNRIWSQFLGRGIVHPIDDFSKDNDPLNPALLKALADGFAAQKFDMKWLIREIVNSDAYQLSGVGTSKDAMPKQFERARVRPLTAEEIVATMRTATGTEIDPKNPNANWDYFLRAFGEPANGLGEFQGGLGEHLFLNNSDQVRGLIRRKKGNLADQILTSKDPWEKRVERMYLSVLSRPPKPKELEAFVKFIEQEKKPEAAVEDAIWVLINSGEFRFNH